jgi:hypothetical protein
MTIEREPDPGDTVWWYDLDLEAVVSGRVIRVAHLHNSTTVYFAKEDGHRIAAPPRPVQDCRDSPQEARAAGLNLLEAMAEEVNRLYEKLESQRQ